MPLFQKSGGIMRSLVIHFVCCLGWFSCFAFAQLHISEGVTGSLNFPALGITCLANFAIFAAIRIRGRRLDLEMGARDVLDILTSRKLYNIDGIEDGRGLTTCPFTDSRRVRDLSSASVVILSNGTSSDGRVRNGRVRRVSDLSSASVVILSNGAPNWSIREFMKSIAPIVDSILLQFLPLRNAGVNVEPCKCRGNECGCIVFWSVEESTIMLALRIPDTLKLLPNSRCLLPCLTCVRNGCHGCKDDVLRVEGPLPLEQQSDDGYKLVSEILDERAVALSILAGEPICICIPVNDARNDDWTKLLIRSLRSKDAEGRGVTVMASEALEGYLAGGIGGEEGNVEYGIFSFIMPRLTEVLVNLVLAFWFRLDGFSSGLVARRTVRDHLVDSKGSGPAANAFITKAVVKSSQDNTQVCQVLRFRGNIVCITTYLTGCVNLVASLGWALLISFEGEGGADSSPTPSMAILVVIIAAIGTALGMDLASFLANGWKQKVDIISFCKGASIVIIYTVTSPVLLPVCLILKWLHVADDDDGFIIVLAGAALEMVCIVAGSAVAGTLGIKSFGRWVYAALQLLVWLNWATGAYLFNSAGYPPEITVVSMYSSAFLLNGVLAGVRCKWEAWPWKDNPLFSRKLGR